MDLDWLHLGLQLFGTPLRAAINHRKLSQIRQLQAPKTTAQSRIMSLIRQLNSLAEPFGAEKFSYLLPAASFQGPHANANKTLSGQIAAKKSWI